MLVIFPPKSLIHVMLLTGADAIKAARERLHRDNSDPRDVNIFVGLDLKSVSDADLKELRTLLCGTLSLRDRRPWSNNGAQKSPYEKKTYLGRNFDSIFI